MGEKTIVSVAYECERRFFPRKNIEDTFYAIQSTFRSLEMHSKRCHKFRICSVIL